ncbi:MAG TPA: cbb3-type cytochrome c oxidase subunit I [Solirubrobacterales bacterium]
MSATAPRPAIALRPPLGSRRRASLLEVLSSTDHKRIGLLTTVTAFCFFLIGGSLALTMRAELAKPGLQFLSDHTYNELFTMHGSSMFYLFAAPVVMGVGLYFVPLQIGAARLLWPRLALAGYWLFAAAGVIMYSGFLTQQGAATFGWTAFFPLSDSQATPGIGTDLWIIAVILATLGVILQALSLLATIVRLRAPGMTMLRMPLFTWSELVTVFMVITGFPVLIVAMTLLYMDRQGASIFSSSPEGQVTYQHLFWFYGHPVVYVVFFPLVGVVGETIATFSRRRFFGFRTTVVSLLLFSAISMSVWGHHMFATNQVSNRYFSLTSTILLIPAGIEYFGFLATMAGGRIRLASPMLFAIGFVLLFLIGGLTGIMVASPPLDYHVHDTYFVVAHFHYTLFGGTVFGLFAAIHYWFPKVTGRLLDERLARATFVLLFAGALAAFIPMFFLGSQGMARRVADYLPLHHWTALNTLSTLGAFTIFLGVLVFLVNVMRSLRLGAPAGPDPWQGQTLEWATPSPPPRHNFAALPPIRSHTPLFDMRERGEDPIRGLGLDREEALAR